MPRGWFVSLGARGTGSLRGRSNGGKLPRGRSWRGGCLASSGGIGFGLSCSGPTGAGTGLAIVGWRCLRSGLGFPALLPATSTLTIGGGLRCRMRWSLSGVARPWRSPSPIGAATRPRPLPRPRRWPRASPNTPRRWPRAGASPSGCASTSPSSSATAIPAARTRAPTPSWPGSATTTSASATAAALACSRRSGGWRRSWRRSASSASPASSSSTATCSSWRARSPPRCAGPDSARSVLPPGRGRGSSVSSIVCYLTGLSHVDPVEADLFSGRFLNEETTSMPDIDLDFPRDIREVLIPRVHERYGADRSALVAAFPTYRPKGAVRDLGKALGLPPAEIDRVAKTVGFHESAAEIERDLAAALGRRACCRAALAGAALARRRDHGPAPPLLPAPGRDGDLDPAADRRLPGRAGGDGGTADGAVGQGLLRRRRLPQDRPARAGDALGGRALRRGDRPRPRRAARPLADPARRRRDLRIDPRRRDHRRLPDREPRADADAAADPAARPRRRRRPGGAGPPGADPGRRHPPIYREAQAPPREPRLRDPLRAPAAGAGAGGDAGDDRLPGAGDRGGDGALGLHLLRGRGAAAGDEPQALRGGDPRAPPALPRRRRRQRRPARRSPKRSGSRSRASPASASRRRTRPPSACSPTSRPGCGSTTAPSSSARC